MKTLNHNHPQPRKYNPHPAEADLLIAETGENENNRFNQFHPDHPVESFPLEKTCQAEILVHSCCLLLHTMGYHGTAFTGGSSSSPQGWEQVIPNQIIVVILPNLPQHTLRLSSPNFWQISLRNFGRSFDMFLPQQSSLQLTVGWSRSKLGLVQYHILIYIYINMYIYIYIHVCGCLKSWVSLNPLVHQHPIEMTMLGCIPFSEIPYVMNGWFNANSDHNLRGPHRLPRWFQRQPTPPDKLNSHITLQFRNWDSASLK